METTKLDGGHFRRMSSLPLSPPDLLPDPYLHPHPPLWTPFSPGLMNQVAKLMTCPKALGKRVSQSGVKSILHSSSYHTPAQPSLAPTAVFLPLLSVLTQAHTLNQQFSTCGFRSWGCVSNDPFIRKHRY